MSAAGKNAIETFFGQRFFEKRKVFGKRLFFERLHPPFGRDDGKVFIAKKIGFRRLFRCGGAYEQAFSAFYVQVGAHAEKGLFKMLFKSRNAVDGQRVASKNNSRKTVDKRL